MRVFAFADKDTFITDVIITNTFRADDANVGQAGTLDLFKLHDESTLPGSASGAQEISRILIRFDLNAFSALTAANQPLSGTRLNSATFRLKMFDVKHSDTVPSNFNVVVYPLSRTFDEGIGYDNFAYQDLDAANFITASGNASTAVTWSLSGANLIGWMGHTASDVFTGSSAYPGLGNTDLFATQAFTDGTEDLDVNVTTIVSGQLVGIISNHGLRIGFSGSEETDGATRFIKRFFSRHGNIFSKQPRLEVHFNDTIFDNYNNFVFDTTGTLFLNNVVRGTYTDILSGSTILTGTTAGVVEGAAKYTWTVPIISIKSGSFSQTFTGSKYDTGQYSASFAIRSIEPTLTGEIRNAGSATFNVVWQSANHDMPFLSSSLIIKEITRDSFIKPKRYRIDVSNLKREYSKDEIAQIRLFVKETKYSVVASRTPSEIDSTIIDTMYYQIRELQTNDIIMPFDKTSSTTRISYDKHSNYFNLRMASFAPGRNFKIEFLIVEDGIEQIIDDNIVFRVIK
jgi:hypothetical protein